jgi:hypothetical protein
VDNIKINLVVIEWDGVDWIGLAQYRESAEFFECGKEPSGCTKCLETIQ